MSAAQAVSRPAFAHASEAELARILDYYQVRWEYEPDTFPIGWNMAGDVVESFSPDFYLPDMDLYVELTTLKQKLVRKKNRKLRRLRELYPDIRIKLFYARDFRMLLLKFGRHGLLAELSGTIGQATPPRSADRIVSEAGGAQAHDPVFPDLADVIGSVDGGQDPAPPADGLLAADEAAYPSEITAPPARSRHRPRRRHRHPGATSPVPADAMITRSDEAGDT